MKPEGIDNETIEEDNVQPQNAPVNNEEGPVLRAASDDLSVWQSVRRFKRVGYIAMAAAFCASLDGYRKIAWYIIKRAAQYLLTMAEINLNGGIVANKGFVQQMASPGTKIIAGTYISAWSGIQSTGQTIGQIVWIISAEKPEDYETNASDHSFCNLSQRDLAVNWHFGSSGSLLSL